jgi:hypothetical protein
MISDLSSFDHVKEVSIVYDPVSNLNERVFQVCWARQLRRLMVTTTVHVLQYIFLIFFVIVQLHRQSCIFSSSLLGGFDELSKLEVCLICRFSFHAVQINV